MIHVLNVTPGLERANENALTADQFASKPWLLYRTGASMVPVTTVDVKATTGRTKTLAYLDKSKDWFLRQMFPYGRAGKGEGRVGQEARAIVKRELAKARAEVNSDDRLYIMMSYISH